ncbi:MAG: hypothetical protein DWQ44_07840 [Bacteroidetes bacterium]|nr:MAG: hypothetical protein DWQ33_06960 [Bacteroidota bacterium]REJ99675.1 MAG: hypothetical protein DWQ39_12140 [Bacteroidota bacterium]REK33908.1 MAG: hypothetical protein DWQ44_07840 [Bacteroidota bacterium]REK47673.1 MAG: hypothetical protein DWQ48_11875 [Bacteroidota bacterium]
MNIKILKENSPVFLVLLFAFFLSSWQIFSIVSLVILIPLVIIRYGIGSIWKTFKSRKLLLMFPLYYILHLAGLLNTENFSYATLDLQIKLSFLLMPLFLAPVLKETKAAKLKNAYISGVIFSLLFCLIFAAWRFIQEGDSIVFFYGEYSRFMHSTYYTMHINLAMIFLFEKLIPKESERSRKSDLLSFIGIIFMAISIFMLSSRTGTAVMYITVFSFLIIRYLIPAFSFFKAGKVLILVLLFGLLHSAVLVVYDRYSEVAPEITLEMENKTVQDGAVPAQVSSLSSRLFIWPLSWRIIIENPLTGVGTGDIKDVLVSEYEKAGFTEGVEKKLNPHNQFLHTGVILGFPGMIFLLILFIIFSWEYFERRNSLAILFNAIIFLNALTESVLERQAGVLLFCFFTMVFLMHISEKRKIVSRSAGDK